MRSGPRGLVPSGSSGTTTTAFVVAPGTPPIRPASPIVMVLVPTLTSAGAVPTSWAAAALPTAGSIVASFPDSAASGNRGPGAWSTTAAYWAGSTYTTDSENPEDSDPVSTSAKAVATTPGTEETCVLQGRGRLVIVADLDDGVGAHLLPGRGHLGLGHRRAIMSGNATMASTRTKANDGKTVPGGVRVARVRPTNATTPRDRPAIRASSRTRGG